MAYVDLWPYQNVPTPVSIANGGTGATTAAQARANLGVADEWNIVDVNAGPYNASAGEALICDGTFTVNLPAAPNDADRILVKLITADTVTVDGQGNNIDGGGTNTVDTQYESKTYLWDDDNGEWHVI